MVDRDVEVPVRMGDQPQQMMGIGLPGPNCQNVLAQAFGLVRLPRVPMCASLRQGLVDRDSGWCGITHATPPLIGCLVVASWVTG